MPGMSSQQYEKNYTETDLENSGENLSLQLPAHTYMLLASSER